MARRRIDTLLAERGLAGSRSSAAEAVRAGHVRVGPDGPLAIRPSQLVPEGADLQLVDAPSYVSRGGVKLANALDTLELEVAGLECLDVGASTGGFTDCLLQRGAARVIALDVAYGQLDWRLRKDRRVKVIERQNARELEPGMLPYRPRLATADVSFISLAKVLPAIAACLEPEGEVLALVKPQFELGPQRVGKGGVVRSPDDRREALVAVGEAARDHGLGVLGFASSGLPGPKGNRESFVHCRLGAVGVPDLVKAAKEVEP